MPKNPEICVQKLQFLETFLFIVHLSGVTWNQRDIKWCSDQYLTRTYPISDMSHHQRNELQVA